MNVAFVRERACNVTGPSFESRLRLLPKGAASKLSLRHSYPGWLGFGINISLLLVSASE